MRDLLRPLRAAAPRLRHCLLWAALPALAGCGGTPLHQAALGVAELRSWTATTQLVAELWLQQRAPTAYTRATLLRARGTLRQAAAELAGPGMPAEVRARSPLLSLPAGAAGRLEAAVARGDRGAVRRELAALRGPLAEIAALQARLAAREEG